MNGKSKRRAAEEKARRQIIKLSLVTAAVLAVLIAAFALIYFGGELFSDKEAAAPTFSGEYPSATITLENGGVIEFEIYPDKAPNTAANFIELANSGFYDGLIFHRVDAGFVIQGGDPNGDGTGGPGYAIAGEFANNGYKWNDISHERGVVSMARSSASMDSAGSQFFIMLDAAKSLDGNYAAFGRVISGMDVVDEIAVVRVDVVDKPVEDIVIKSIRVETHGVEYVSEKID